MENTIHAFEEKFISKKARATLGRRQRTEVTAGESSIGCDIAVLITKRFFIECHDEIKNDNLTEKYIVITDLSKFYDAFNIEITNNKMKKNGDYTIYHEILSKMVKKRKITIKLNDNIIKNELIPDKRTRQGGPSSHNYTTYETEIIYDEYEEKDMRTKIGKGFIGGVNYVDDNTFFEKTVNGVEKRIIVSTRQCKDNKWRINTDKTKVVIVNKTNTSNEKMKKLIEKYDLKILKKSMKVLGYGFTSKLYNGRYHIKQQLKKMIPVKIKLESMQILKNVRTVNINVFGWMVKIRPYCIYLTNIINIYAEKGLMKKIEDVQDDFIKRAWDVPQKYNTDILLLLSGINKVECIINKIKMKTFYKIMSKTYINLFKYIKNKIFSLDYDKMEKEMKYYDIKNEKFIYQIIVLYKKYDNIENIKEILYRNFYFDKYYEKKNNNNNIIDKEKLTKNQKEMKISEINNIECQRMLDTIQMYHRNELLESIKEKKMIIRFWVIKNYKIEMEKYNQFQEKYKSIDQFREAYGGLYDTIYYKNDKKPYVTNLINKAIQINLIKDEKIIKIKIQLLTGLLTWRYHYLNKKCPLCNKKYIRPDLHVLYSCKCTEKYHNNQTNEEEMKKIEEYELRKEIIPYYNQDKINKLCKELKMKYKCFVNKYQNDIEYTKQLLYNLENDM